MVLQTRAKGVFIRHWSVGDVSVTSVRDLALLVLGMIAQRRGGLAAMKSEPFEWDCGANAGSLLSSTIMCAAYEVGLVLDFSLASF